MSDSTPVVYVIILNYNNIADTLKTIHSVRALHYDNFRLLVVENSTDTTVPYAIKKEFPEIEILENGSNLGYAGGNNAGILYAMREEPDYILLLNNDIQAAPDCLDILVAALEENPDCVACQPLVLYAEKPDVIWSAGTIYQLGYPWLYLKDSTTIPQELFTPPFGLVGCTILFRVSALKNIGLFDTSLFLMHEETEWCIRANKAGFDLLVAPSARVLHTVSATLGSLSIPYLYYVSRNWILVAKKHFSFSSYCIVIFTEFLFRFPYYCLNLIQKKQPGMIRYYLTGLLDGVRGVAGEMKIR